jgi:putative drug exporter of the RND superfamily
MFNWLANLVYKRPAWILIFWAVVLLAAAPLANLAPKRFSGSTSSVKNSEAERVNRLIETEFGQQRVDTTLIVTEGNRDFKDTDFLERYDALVTKLEAVEGVKSVTRFDAESPLKLFGEADGKRISATVLETRLSQPEPVLEEIRGLTRAAGLPDTQLYVTGATAITKDFIERSESDTKRSEFAALPLTGLVLVLAFGALVAAGIPLIVGMLSITLSLALIYLVTYVFSVTSFAQSVVTMLGLGAGIDYALLLVNRFREELSSGRESRQAAANTVRTAGRAVGFSGLTVAIAMAALLIPDLLFIRSIGVAGVLVVLMTVLVSVSAVPALLAIIGERVNSPRRLQFKLTSSGEKSAFWAAWAERVMRRPWLYAIAISGLLLLIASPALQMKLGYTGAWGLTQNVESRRGLELIRPLELGGSLDTFEVVLDLQDQDFREARSAWRTLDATLAGWDDVRLVISPFLTSRTDLSSTGGGAGGITALATLTERSISQNRRYLRLSVIPKDAVPPSRIPDWISRLRTAGAEAGFKNVILGGAPVGSQEFTNALVSSMPLAIGTVFVATFILLAIAFRSLVIPIKSIIMNTLTVGASYGVITLIFQDGFLAQFLNVPTDIGAIDSSLPLIMFAVTFGLSMDYEIFLLSRVQEAHLSGMKTVESVKGALERTAGVITSAAVIMLIVFAAFVQGDVVANKTIGVGLFVAVLLDATLVRLMLVPAVLALAGEWNWWMPQGLKKALPKVSLEH